MLICVSEELIELKEELKNRGYIIIESDNKLPCDAIICNIKENGLSKSTKENNMRIEGTLIIDSSCKTIDEIEYILNNRSYSNIL